MDVKRKEELIAKLKADREQAAVRRKAEESEKKSKRHAIQKQKRKERQSRKLINVRSESVEKVVPKKQKGTEVCHPQTPKHLSQKRRKCRTACPVLVNLGGLAVQGQKKHNVENKNGQSQLHNTTAEKNIELTVKRRKKFSGNCKQTCNKKQQQQKAKWRLSSQKYRDRKKNDPVLAEQQRHKEHERYLRRKEAKQIKLIGDLNATAKRRKRRAWREHTAAYRKRQKVSQECDNYINENSPPQTPSCVPADVPVSSSVQAVRGRRRVRRDRSAAYRQLRKVQNMLEAAQKRAEKYRKRLQRLSHNSVSSPSPRKKVTSFLRGRKVYADVRKKLMLSECISSQLSRNAKVLKSDKEKQIFTRAVSGKIIRKYLGKYRMLSAVKEFCPYWRYRSMHSLQTGNKLDNYIRKARMSDVRSWQRKRVLLFFEDDSNSRVCPGKKDCVSRGGQKKQKRILCDSLVNLHIKFCQMHNIEMCYSKFCSLKPFWVVQPDVADRQTCLCVKHENLTLLVHKMHRLGIINERSVLEVCKETVCNAASKECMYGDCEKCQGKILSVNDTGIKSFYHKWCTRTEQRTKATNGTEIKVKVTSKQQMEATSHDMIKILQSDLPEFKRHQYRCYHQQSLLAKMKSQLSHKECILIIDFSENFACKYASEPQSIHFGASRSQVTLHTGVLYYRSQADDNLVCTSFCTVSDSLRHDSSAVWAHLKPVLKSVAAKCPEIDTINIWSDGPTTQYKNKRNFAIFAHLGQFTNFKKASWNFTESGHGKSPADAIGGSVKRQLDRTIAFGTDITNAEVLCNTLLMQNVTSTEIFLVTDSDITDIDEQFDTSQLKPVKGTLQLHQLAWVSCKSSHLSLRYLSCVECPFDQACSHFGAGSAVLNIAVKNSHSTSPVNVEQCGGSVNVIIGNTDVSVPDDVEYTDNADSSTPDNSGCPDALQTVESLVSEITPGDVEQRGDLLNVIIGNTDVSVPDDVEYTDNADSSTPDNSGCPDALQTGESTSDVALEHLNISQYVAVIYDNKWYPGIVKTVETATTHTATATVQFMDRSGKNFVWPSKPYIETLPIEELLCVINGEPIAVSKTRYQFQDSARVDALCAEVLSD